MALRFCLVACITMMVSEVRQSQGNPIPACDSGVCWRDRVDVVNDNVQISLRVTEGILTIIRPFRIDGDQTDYSSVNFDDNSDVKEQLSIKVAMLMAEWNALETHSTTTMYDRETAYAQTARTARRFRQHLSLLIREARILLRSIDCDADDSETTPTIPTLEVPSLNVLFSGSYLVVKDLQRLLLLWSQRNGALQCATA